ncbi:MAG: TIGR03750 family conjugal transfer protein [Gammaproteobacteria bacterium]|nr:MAG: TIGR03750 family conjugal transfer protein [Gammaproteobacteria bacterium]
MDFEYERDLTYEDPRILPRRVNEPAAVFSGCTLNETTAIVIVSFLFWITMALVLGPLFGVTALFFGASIVLTILSTYALANYLRALKHGRPSGYYQQMMMLKLEALGVGESHLYRASGDLEIGRSEQYLSARRRYRYRYVSEEEYQQGVEGRAEDAEAEVHYTSVFADFSEPKTERDILAGEHHEQA